MTGHIVEILVALAGVAASIGAAFLTARSIGKQQEERLREQMKLENSVESVLFKLLENPNYKTRSLSKIKKHIRGFPKDDDLRMALLRAGAVMVREKDGEEFWGLLSLNEDAVK